MSKTRDYLVKKAKSIGIAESVYKNLNNEELAAQIKDRTGKDVGGLAALDKTAGSAKNGEVITGTVQQQKYNQHIPAGAHVGIILNPAPVTLLPTAAPFSQDSKMYPVWAVCHAVTRWLQPNIVGFLIGVLLSKHVLWSIGL